MVSLDLNKYSPWDRSEESGSYFYLSLSLCLSPLSQISSAEFNHSSFIIPLYSQQGTKVVQEQNTEPAATAVFRPSAASLFVLTP